MDNDPEFISLKMATWAEGNNIELEFINPGRPTQNSFIERLNRTFRDEVQDFYIFHPLSEVCEVPDNWIIEYNEIRSHDSLGKLTPKELLTAQ